MQYYDLEKIERFIEYEIDTIIKKSSDDETIEQLKEFKNAAINKLQEMQENKRLILDPLVTQQFYKTFAGYEVVYDERKGYYLCLAIKSLLGMESIKKLLKESYRNYDKVMERFNEQFAILGEIKNNLETIREDQKIYNNINHPTMKRHFKLCQRLDLIYEVPFDILGVLFEKTNLSSMKVDKDALRIYEMEYKKPLYTLEQSKQLTKQGSGGGEE